MKKIAFAMLFTVASATRLVAQDVASPPTPFPPIPSVHSSIAELSKLLSSPILTECETFGAVQPVTAPANLSIQISGPVQLAMVGHGASNTSFSILSHDILKFEPTGVGGIFGNSAPHWAYARPFQLNVANFSISAEWRAGLNTIPPVSYQTIYVHQTRCKEGLRIGLIASQPNYPNTTATLDIRAGRKLETGQLVGPWWIIK